VFKMLAISTTQEIEVNTFLIPLSPKLFLNNTNR